jgi:hypothetical protein
VRAGRAGERKAWRPVVDSNLVQSLAGHAVGGIINVQNASIMETFGHEASMTLDAADYLHAIDLRHHR